MNLDASDPVGVSRADDLNMLADAVEAVPSATFADASTPDMLPISEYY
jgi:hypothetical protein